MSDPLLDAISSDLVRELISNGSSVKIFNKIYKDLDTGSLEEYLGKKVGITKKE